MREFAETLLATLAMLAPFLLLGFALAGLLHAFVPRSLLTRAMGGTGIGPTLRASLLGIPLPLCSCSVIPVATELRRQGAGRGATAAFMVATPETGVDSISASFALLHPVLVVARPLAAMVTAVTTGLVIEGLAPPPEAPAEEKTGCCHHDPAEQVAGDGLGVRGGLRYAFDDLLGEIAPYLVPALLITAALGVFLEPSALLGLDVAPWLQRIAALLIGLPLYVCATAATPVAAGMLVAGASPGAALVFLLAGPATNVVTLSAVSQNLGRRAAFLYAVSVAGLSLGFGSVLDLLWIDLAGFGANAGQLLDHQHLGWLEYGCGAVLLVLLAWHLGRRALRRWRRQPSGEAQPDAS